MFDPCLRSLEIEAMFDRRLDESAAEEARAHVASCEACRELLAKLEDLRMRLQAGAGAPNAFAMRRIRRELLDPVSAKRPIELRWGRLLPALALTIAAVCGLFFWLRGPSTTDVTMVAAPGSRYVRETEGQYDIVRLSDGAFDFDVHAHASGKRLLVIVPDGEIEDIGTRFRVVVKEGATREITVSEGEVELRRRGASPLRLIAGMSYRPLPEEPMAELASAVPTAVAPAIVPPAPSTAASANASAHASAHVRTVDALPTAGRTPAVGASAPQTLPGTTPEDVAYMQVIRLIRAGREEEARASARKYLSDFPNGLRRNEMAAIGAKPP